MAPSSSSSSLVLSATLAGITFFGLNFFKDTLLSSEKGKVFTGFMCSIIYMLLLTAYGNIKSNIKWFDMLLCLFPAEIIASSFHGVCVTTCFLFSMVISFELHKVAQHIYGGAEQGTTTQASSTSSTQANDKKRR
ncbi:predicted protein [Naegleria gruberi]|uniref:Predicted protein n=1 Tax=Naegleria gruberi TaxID=5762 RepID=D2VT84_NAEGR|nr:uncharacterized protein NAEGRDRAFT_72210 [Naegleria gruberi]EFC40038.1 predicted protein [Naegleria gruberi]|eukprot:XP_002672782.1 predicted protein [Naegleria gruberi strain NEG-M]